MKRKTNPGDVYRAAALALERGETDFPCIAVGANTPYGSSRDWHTPTTLAGRFILAMAPGSQRETDTHEASNAYLHDFPGWEAFVARGRDHSILALCFAAAMADTGDLP